MTDKQYEDMTTIMMFGRIFADQMYKCFEENGLLGKYKLDIGVGKNYDLHGERLACDVELSLVTEGKAKNDKAFWDEYRKTKMSQMRMVGKEWCIYNDPQAKAGDLPPEVQIREERIVEQGDSETSSKPYPSDGFWIGADFNDTDVGGR